jgi:hypothetical protein
MKRLNAELEESLIKAEDTYTKTMEDIDQDFQGKDRKGKSLTDYIADDLTALKDLAVKTFKDIMDEFTQIGQGDDPLGTENARKGLDKLQEELDEIQEQIKRINAEMAKMSGEWIKLERGVQKQMDRVILSDPAQWRKHQMEQARYYLERSAFAEEDQPQMLARFEQQLDTLENVRTLKTVADDVGNAFGDMFDEIIDKGKVTKEMFIDLARTIVNTLLKRLLVQGIVNAISSGIFGVGVQAMGASATSAAAMAGRQGLVYHNLTQPKFDTGGVVWGPQKYRGAEIGHGANGEGVLPLTRTRGGKLGVLVENATPGEAPQVNVRVVNVHDPNEIPAMLETPAGEQAVMNIFRKNRAAFEQS